MCVILARMHAHMHSYSGIIQGRLDFSSIYIIGQLQQLYVIRTVHASKKNMCLLILLWLDDFANYDY